MCSRPPREGLKSARNGKEQRRVRLRAAVKNLVFERSIKAGHNDLYDHPDFAQAAREALTRVEAASSEAPAVPKRHPWPARIDGNGNAVTWSYTGGGEDDHKPVFKVSVTDARTGSPTRPPFEIKGVVMDLHFFDTAFVIETGG